MKLKDMSKEELELLSYTDLTNLLLEENGKSMNTPTIFKRICELLSYSEEDYENKIGDYYTSLTIDKRFVLLENHEWDLRERHAVEIIIDDEDEEDIEEEDLEEVEEDEIEDIDEEPIDEEDDLEDLTVIDEEDEENM